MVRVIEVSNLHYNYPDGTPALRGLTFDVHEGEFVALIGQNGAGKTTLAKSLNGLLKPTDGYVKVADLDTRTKGIIKKLVTQVGYIFQNPDHQLFNSTVKSEIAYAPRNIGLTETETQARVAEAARVAGVRDEFFDMHPFFLTKGLRQRVSIASILALKPKVLIVDEPTTGQDYRQSVEVMNFLRVLNEKEGHTIIIITHEIDIVARYTKRTIALSQGRILLDGPTGEVLSQTDILRQTFVKPPQATLIAQRLGLPGPIVTYEELCDAFKRRVEERAALAPAAGAEG